MPEDEDEDEDVDEVEDEDDQDITEEDDIHEDNEEDELEEPNDRNGWQAIDPFPYGEIEIVLDGDTKSMKTKLFEKACYLDTSVHHTVFEQTRGKLCTLNIFLMM